MHLKTTTHPSCILCFWYWRLRIKKKRYASTDSDFAKSMFCTDSGSTPHIHTKNQLFHWGLPLEKEFLLPRRRLKKNTQRFTQHQPLLLFGEGMRGSEHHTVEHAKKTEHPPIWEDITKGDMWHPQPWRLQRSATSSLSAPRELHTTPPPGRELQTHRHQRKEKDQHTTSFFHQAE